MQTKVNIIEYSPTYDRQEQALINLIIWSLRGRRVTAMECTRIASKEFGLLVDYHVFSNTLDRQEREGKVKFICHDRSGMCVYQV